MLGYTSGSQKISSRIIWLSIMLLALVLNNADVHDNIVRYNTGGILVFDYLTYLFLLEKIRVFIITIYENNTETLHLRLVQGVCAGRKWHINGS